MDSEAGGKIAVAQPDFKNLKFHPMTNAIQSLTQTTPAVHAMQWGWLAGYGAVIAVVATAWRQFVSFFKWVFGLVICCAVVKNDAADAVASYTFDKGVRSPFGVKLFGGSKAYVNTSRRVEVVGFESISSDPTLFWFNRRPLLIARRNSGWDKSMGGTGEVGDNAGGGKLFKIWFIRGTFHADEFVGNAVRHLNSLYNTNKEESESGKLERFSVIRVCNLHSRRIGQCGEITPEKGGHSSERIVSDIEEQIKTKSIRLINLTPHEIGIKQEGKSAFNGFSFPKDVMDSLSEIKIWLENEEWFHSKGIPWRRGWLLHGKPGTGKSTLVKSIAMQFDLPVHVLDIGSFDNESFVDAWKKIQQNAPAIALIEDIDAVFSGRENLLQKRERDTLTFDCLLNTISGVDNCDGVLLFITTNNLSSIDPALGIPDSAGNSSRPGRIDRLIHLKEVEVEERKKIAAHVLSDFPELVDKTVESGVGETAAQFQSKCAALAMKAFWSKA